MEKPAEKMVRTISVVGHLPGGGGLHQLQRHGPVAHRLGVDAAAVVVHLDVQRLPRQPGSQARWWPRPACPGAGPPLGALDAVVDGVLDQVQQRLVQPFQHLPVDLGRLAFGAQLHLLAQLPSRARTAIG